VWVQQLSQKYALCAICALCPFVCARAYPCAWDISNAEALIGVWLRFLVASLAIYGKLVRYSDDDNNDDDDDDQ